MASQNLTSQISHLRLFLSADLENSTAFKYKPNGGSQKIWFEALELFYKTFQEKLKANWDAGDTAQKWLGTKNLSRKESPALWKVLGDELIFIFDIKHHVEVLSCVQCFEQTIVDMRQALQPQKYQPLDVKGTVWTAGFPLINSEILTSPASLSRQNEIKEAVRLSGNGKSSASLVANILGLEQYDNRERDFVGPNIDIGFRLAKVANPRRLVLSLEAALLVAAGAQSIDKTSRTHILADGEIVLPGVFQGATKYPILWIDTMRDHYDQADEKKIFRRPSVHTNADMERFCKERLADLGGYGLVVPYIASPIETKFNDVDKKHKKQLDKLQREINDRLSYEGQAADTNGDTSGAGSTDNSKKLMPTLLKATARSRTGAGAKKPAAKAKPSRKPRKKSARRNRPASAR